MRGLLLIIGDGGEELVSQAAGDVHMYDSTWTSWDEAAATGRGAQGIG